MLRKFVIALTVTGVALSLTACNTVRGAGKDLESAANTTQDAMN